MLRNHPPLDPPPIPPPPPPLPMHFHCIDSDFESPLPIFSKPVGNTAILKYIKKETEQSIYNFFWNYKNMRPPRHLVQLFIWKGGLGILDIDIQLSPLKTKCIQRLLNPTNASWKDCMLY